MVKKFIGEFYKWQVKITCCVDEIIEHVIDCVVWLGLDKGRKELVKDGSYLCFVVLGFLVLTHLNKFFVFMNNNYIEGSSKIMKKREKG